MHPLEIVAVAITFFSILFAVKEKIFTFPFGIIGTCLFGYIFFSEGLYSSATLQVVFLSFNIFGWYRWTHPKLGEAKSDKTLAVSWLTNKGRAVAILSMLAFMGLFVFITLNLHSWLPNIFPTSRELWIVCVDAYIMSASIVGQYLMAVKKVENWFFWFAVDIVAAPFYFFTVGWLTGLLYLVFITTSLMGFIAWRKSKQ